MFVSLLHCRLRYFDAERQRPGLPPDVAALVTQLALTQTTVQLVNLGLVPRTLIVQAGASPSIGFARYALRSWAATILVHLTKRRACQT